MQKVVISNYQAPGDIVVLTGAVRDLQRNNPGKFEVSVQTTAQELWHGNGYLSKVQCDGSTKYVKAEYPLIHRSNSGPYHFHDGFCDFLEQALSVRITDRWCRGDVYVTDEERKWISQVHEVTGKDSRYWIVVNGGKFDFTAKWWDPARMQKVVEQMSDVLFVQVGESGHQHPALRGPNVIDLRGKTNVRQIVRLVYHSSGVICPVTFLMHLAAAVPVRPEKVGGRKRRPCVVIAGAREPMRWEAYTSHAYLHTCGVLPCSGEGGCWKSRVEKRRDGEKHDDSVCMNPVKTASGAVIPRCLHLIETRHVVEAIRRYEDGDAGQPSGQVDDSQCSSVALGGSAPGPLFAGQEATHGV